MAQRRRKRNAGTSQTFVILVMALFLGFAGGLGGSFIGAKLFSANSSGAVYVSSGKGVSSSNDASAIAEKMTKSVVAITTEEIRTNNFWYGSQVSSGAGSGVIMTNDGYIITCAHVVKGASKITVTTYDNQSYNASLVGSSTNEDIAVIKINAEGLTPAVFANTDHLVQGQTVYAVGNPEGTFSDSITSGILSALNRDIEVAIEDDDEDYQSFGFGQYVAQSKTIKLTVIQTDAAVSPGNSGGGLFNAAGELIGIVNAKSSSENSEGLGFAIYGNHALKIAQDLIKNGQ
ncbi:MAG: trypsin-like peptidase domain-containing protein [Erysipelotrichaceae bacterium]|nr:trypsin-like peptidase domain-containing protein [Erysipelotrichaceae bacterium]